MSRYAPGSMVPYDLAIHQREAQAQRPPGMVLSLFGSAATSVEAERAEAAKFPQVIPVPQAPAATPAMATVQAVANLEGIKSQLQTRLEAIDRALEEHDKLKRERRQIQAMLEACMVQGV